MVNFDRGDPKNIIILDDSMGLLQEAITWQSSNMNHAQNIAVRMFEQPTKCLHSLRTKYNLVLALVTNLTTCHSLIS